MSLQEAPERVPVQTERGVRFVPLGGLGQIGMNCFALEQQDGDILVVDCGVTFPDDDLGVDVLHPDFRWLLERQERLAGVFVTHGHEDHIGALPYLLRSLRSLPTVHAPTHACALIAARLRDHGLDAGCLAEVEAGRVYPVGEFAVEPVPVAHSIIDAMALAIETCAGTIFHTGDFDLDESQPAGVTTDEVRLGQIGERGVRLLLSDSTNVDNAERHGSEAQVAAALEHLIDEASGRVVVGMFSSNVHRLFALGRIAERTGRRLCFLGRSLERHVRAATGIGRLAYPPGLLTAADRLRDLPANQVLVVAGGSQAEGASSLRRLSLGTHRFLDLEPGDRVILSARIIPGNERPVLTMMNDLLRAGVEVCHSRTHPDVHTSGHAGRSEQERMLRLLRPESFVPVHGTLHHMRRHQELARSCGVTDTLVVENGTPVLIRPGQGLQIERGVPSGTVRIAMGGREMGEGVVRERLELARAGVVFVSLGLDDQDELDLGPHVSAVGIPGLDQDDYGLTLVERDVASALRRRKKGRVLDWREVVRRTARRTVVELTGVRPRVEVHLL